MPPSDFEPIARTECVGCGRGPDQVALKRLNTYSRAFGCLTCYLKYSNCANCGHEKHGSTRHIFVHERDINFGHFLGHCACGCTDYRHGLEAEFDRQFSEHTGKAPIQRKCNHCGNWFNGTTLFCDRCEREWRELNNG